MKTAILEIFLYTTTKQLLIFLRSPPLTSALHVSVSCAFCICCSLSRRSHKNWTCLAVEFWMWSPNKARGILSLHPAAARGQATSAFGHIRLCRLELPPLWMSGRSVNSPQDGHVKLSVAFERFPFWGWRFLVHSSACASTSANGIIEVHPYSLEYGHLTSNCRISLLAYVSGKMSPICIRKEELLKVILIFF